MSQVFRKHQDWDRKFSADTLTKSFRLCITERQSRNTKKNGTHLSRGKSKARYYISCLTNNAKNVGTILTNSDAHRSSNFRHAEQRFGAYGRGLSPSGSPCMELQPSQEDETSYETFQGAAAVEMIPEKSLGQKNTCRISGKSNAASLGDCVVNGRREKKKKKIIHA